MICLGIEKLVKEHKSRISNKKVGLVAHPASVTGDLLHTLDILLNAGAKVEVLFGPEHGFGGEAQDMEPVNGKINGSFGIPLISLYGRDEASLSPNENDLQDLDVLVVDLADVGSRYYTFVWTALLCLRVCNKIGLEMILADRPNPLGGKTIEGEPLEPEFLSFVGLKQVPNRHGMTPGEIVLFAAKEEGIEGGLTVVKMEGWERSMLFGDTGLPWVLPSPNMPTFDTAVVYPGMCLVEATGASEGRGTTRPFELVGQPGIDSYKLSTSLLEMELPGVAFRPVSFKPGFQKHMGRVCGGVQLHVTDLNTFLPYRTGVAVLFALKAEAKGHFRWRHKPYEFVTDRPAIDLLTGSKKVRKAIEYGACVDDVAYTWSKGEKEYAEYRTPHLLY